MPAVTFFLKVYKRPTDRNPFPAGHTVAEKLTVPVKNNTEPSKQILKDKRIISKLTKSLALRESQYLK
jgi:hypothetical protein